jgi:hypothetical protein
VSQNLGEERGVSAEKEGPRRLLSEALMSKKNRENAKNWQQLFKITTKKSLQALKTVPNKLLKRKKNCVFLTYKSKMSNTVFYNFFTKN